YLTVNIANVKGSKTDRVTDNFYSLDSHYEDGKIIHTLNLRRQHNGGDTEHGFYNRQNPAFVRVLVPEGAELLSISGNNRPSFKPLINYVSSGFKIDP